MGDLTKENDMDAIEEQYGNDELMPMQRAIYDFFKDNRPRTEIQCIHDCYAVAKKAWEAGKPRVEKERIEELKCVIALVWGMAEIFDHRKRRPLRAYGLQTKKEFDAAEKILSQLGIMLGERLKHMEAGHERTGSV